MLMKGTSFFRLAATLYAENNYVVRQSTVLRKVVECFFLQNSNKQSTYENLLRSIETSYGLQISIEELQAIVTASPDSFFSNPVGRVEDHQLSLSGVRFLALTGKPQEKSLDHFIDEFLKNPAYLRKQSPWQTSAIYGSASRPATTRST